jgi:uncharacterized protein with beta-barrel porin domain
LAIRRAAELAARCAAIRPAAATDVPRYRSWGELYGISATTGPQGDFAGDGRRTAGGVAGLGGRIAPGVNVGISVDQSHTSIDVPLAQQSATLDLTQIGFTASIDKGPWTWGSRWSMASAISARTATLD